MKMNNDELKALMAELNALSAAFITAWNPFSSKAGWPRTDRSPV
jgi:hypothetical protein